MDENIYFAPQYGDEANRTVVEPNGQDLTLNPVTSTPFSRHASKCIVRSADDVGISYVKEGISMHARAQLTYNAIRDASMLASAATQLVQMTPAAGPVIRHLMEAYADSTAHRIKQWR